MTRALIAIALAVTLAGCKNEQPTATPPAPPAAEKPTTPVTPPTPSAVKPTEETVATDAGAPPSDAGATQGAWMEKAKAGQELYATFHTNQGKFTARLFTKDAPKTVSNFVGLATGEKEWRDPKSGQTIKGKALYDGTIFHRVIPNFMIQGGDPLGTGTGDPGYRFEDEFQSARKFDKTGLLAMANSGPNTNGSQFFVTVAATPWLNNRHTIFGEVVEGYDVVDKISKAQTRPGDRPVSEVKIERIEIKDKA